MILDIEKFVVKEKPLWNELDNLLGTLAREGDKKLSVDDVKRLYYLYERVSEDLAKISTFSGEREVRKYLETLVARAYAEIYAKKGKRVKFNLFKWAAHSFPAAFRRNSKAFMLACAISLFGALFGGIAVTVDPDAKKAVFPEEFRHLQQSPDERVAQEEKMDADRRLEGVQSTFAAQLMTHNIKVSVFCLALGMAWGIGTMLVLFYNGVVLGAVAFDFIMGGQTVFMLGWLMPHGVIEIPAFVIAGQAGLVLGGCILKPRGARARALKEKIDDIVTLAGGVAMLLIWAGLVESFLSQLHEPVIPYFAKIILGVVELIALIAYLGLAGRKKEKEAMSKGAAE